MMRLESIDPLGVDLWKIDPEAFCVFIKHVFPVWKDLSDEEKELVKKFLEDLVEGVKEILDYYWIEDLEELEEVLKDDVTPKGEESLLKMVEEYIDREYLIVCCEKSRSVFLPGSYNDIEHLKKIRKWLIKFKKKGLEKLLWIEAKDSSRIEWAGNELEIYNELASKVLGRKVKEGERLTYEEAERIVGWLLEGWEKFYEEAEKKEWVYTDKWGIRLFIWQRYIIARLKRDENRDFVLDESTVPEDLKKLKKYLEELKQKGAEKFLEIRARDWEEICWKGSELLIYDRLASEVLDRKVKSGGELSFEDALKVIDYLIPGWESFLEEAEKRGWIYEDQEGEKHFIWDREICVKFNEELRPKTPKDIERLKKIKKYLGEIKQKGAENFLEIRSFFMDEIWWSKDTLLILKALASKVLGREVEDGDPLSFEEALKVVEWLLERWKN